MVFHWENPGEETSGASINLDGSVVRAFSRPAGSSLGIDTKILALLEGLIGANFYCD